MIDKSDDAVTIETAIVDILVETIEDIINSGSEDTYNIILEFLDMVLTINTCVFLQIDSADKLNDYINLNGNPGVQHRILNLFTVLLRRINSKLDNIYDNKNNVQSNFISYMLDSITDGMVIGGYNNICLLDSKITTTLTNTINADSLKNNPWFLLCYVFNTNGYRILNNLKNNKVTNTVGGI